VAGLHPISATHTMFSQPFFIPQPKIQILIQRNKTKLLPIMVRENQAPAK
jgi:hypothetical protein